MGVVVCGPQMSQSISTSGLSTDKRYPNNNTDTMATQDFLSPTDTFIQRHLGPTDADAREMLATLGFQSLEELS